MAEVIIYSWREPVGDDEMIDLVESQGGTPSVGWWSKVSSRSHGWGSARNQEGLLVGLVNAAWDGGDHAFLLDTYTRGSHQHRGIGRELVRQATENARAAGCEWLHVDFEPDLARFYLDACGFRRTDAGLMHLSAGRSTGWRGQRDPRSTRCT